MTDLQSSTHLKKTILTNTRLILNDGVHLPLKENQVFALFRLLYPATRKKSLPQCISLWLNPGNFPYALLEFEASKKNRLQDLFTPERIPGSSSPATGDLWARRALHP